MTEGRANSRRIRLENPFTGRIKLLTVTLLITFAFSLVSAPAMAQNFRFSSVRIEGNQRIDPTAILNYAGIARGETVSAAELNDAYQRVLGSGLFESVEIEPRGGLLVIRVVEFPTINLINFEGNRRLKDEALEKLIQSQSRRVFNPEVAERDAAAITAAYADSGRLAARVTPRIIRRSENRVDLVFEVFEGGLVEIERISFVGNQKYSDRRLRRVLETKQATLLRAFIKRDTFVEDRIEFDKQVLRDFYLSRGYVDFRTTAVNAELARDRDGFFITFNVQEGQQFRFGEITTVSDIPEADAEVYQAALRIRPGVIYSPALVENSIARMERLALKQGIDFLRVEPRISRNDRDLTLNVEFVITRGPRIFVERIDIEGNATTLDRVVRRQFKIVEGDPFNPREIRESAERIRALGFFETSDVNAREGSSPDQVVLDVDVEEKPTGSLSFGGAYSTNDGFGLVIKFDEKNFLGRGQRLGLSFSGATETKDYSLTFIEPAFLGRDVEFAFRAGYQDLDYTDVRYDATIGRISPSLTFPLGEFADLTVNYAVKNTELSIPAADLMPGTLLDLEVARGDLWESSVGYSLRYDTRRSGLNPNAGVLVEFGQDFAGVGGDVEFIKSSLRAVAETRILNEEVTLRASLEGGMLHMPNRDSRVMDRYFIGGNTLRGFSRWGVGPREFVAGVQDDPLGGKYFGVARLEAEFPLGLPDEYGITGGLFYDVGSLWGLDASSANTLYEDMSLRHVVGFTIFWDTAFGPLRFNFSKALKKRAQDDEQQFNFSIRTEF